MLKVEGIAFRFLPDPVQIKNALEVSGNFNSVQLVCTICHSTIELKHVIMCSEVSGDLV